MEGYQFILLCILGVIAYMEIGKLKKQVKLQQQQLDRICQLTGNQELAACFVPDDIKASVLQLKNSGKGVEAVRKIREVTAMNVVEAKEYVDKL